MEVSVPGVSGVFEDPPVKEPMKLVPAPIAPPTRVPAGPKALPIEAPVRVEEIRLEPDPAPPVPALLVSPEGRVSAGVSAGVVPATEVSVAVVVVVPEPGA